MCVYARRIFHLSYILACLSGALRAEAGEKGRDQVVCSTQAEKMLRVFE